MNENTPTPLCDTHFEIYGYEKQELLLELARTLERNWREAIAPALALADNNHDKGVIEDLYAMAGDEGVATGFWSRAIANAALRLISQRKKEEMSATQDTRKIWVTFQRKGFHRYPSAPNEVVYLQQVHRHLFKFKVTVEVHHDDREIEFHMFLNWLESLYDQKDLDLDFKSCEMLGKDLMTKIEQRYPKRWVEVEVSEDGECGAIVCNNYTP